ncbi:MAG TPA: hypothetical protein VIF57_23310, partial [Polyangia bacterium]
QVVGDRYHARALTTPRQMRNSMVYVLLNFRKHLRAPACVDPRSSGPHFSGWERAPADTGAPPATAPPGTWMARVGWRRAGGAAAGRGAPRHGAATAPNLISRMLRWAAAPNLNSRMLGLGRAEA